MSYINTPELAESTLNGHIFSYDAKALLAEKKIVLIGDFQLGEIKSISKAGYHIYHIKLTDKVHVIEKLKRIPFKEIAGFIVSLTEIKLFKKQLDIIKRLGLHNYYPVFAYSPSMQAPELMKQFEVIDEVITVLDDKRLLDFKIDFLSKVKKLSSVRFTFPDKINAVKKFFNSIIRRSFDIIVSSILILLFLPMMLVIAILIKIESSGPIFYISKRAGKHYEIFPFIKFRTMIVDADKKLIDIAHLNQYAGKNKTAQFVKIKNDPRVTRVGSFLRNTSLDELPQLINVLLGHMSLVGNRPLPLYEAATLTSDSYAPRFNAPAGITGLWQVLKRGQDDMSIEERIELDITYSNSNSLLVDLWIMVKTPIAMFQKSDV